MASLEECRSALAQLGERMAENGGGTDAELQRTISCTLPDLQTTFRGLLAGGRLNDLSTDPSTDEAQIRLTMSSDDLISLVDGELSVASAWASGRIKIDASFMDLLKLRSMFS
jgi:SCP-2 sterol transfer family